MVIERKSMAQFSYKARRRSGEVVHGSLDVADRTAALAQLDRLGLFPVSVDASKFGAPAKKEKSADKKPALSGIMPGPIRERAGRIRKPKLQELATFTQQLANLLQAGMPLTVALNSMTHLETKGIPKSVAVGLRQEVMEGRSLSDAMAKQPVIFTDLYINMVKAGEQSGQVVAVLRRMADHFEKFAAVQAKFTSALIYPAFVGVVGIGIIIFFMTFMLPKFMTLFGNMQVQLPPTTQLLISISNLFTGYWWLMLIVLGAIFFVFRRFQATEDGKDKIDEWKMKMPVFGKVMKLNLYGQFARTLSTLLENGVPVLTALKITEQVLPNRVIKEATAKTREAVTDGKTLAQPLAASKIFPQLMVDLVRIGEETGDVPGALKNVADTYENELNLALRVMTNMIEPVMIVAMAGGVGFLLLSVLSAMFSLISNVGSSMGGR